MTLSDAQGLLDPFNLSRNDASKMTNRPPSYNDFVFEAILAPTSETHRYIDLVFERQKAITSQSR